MKHPISYRKIDETTYDFRKLPVGSKIWFQGEKQGYTVKASNVAFAICTKPFNAQKTVLYTIIDWESDVRGAEDLIFGMGAETVEQCEAMLERLTQGESGVSHRNYCALDIVKYQRPKNRKVPKQLAGQTDIEEEINFRGGNRG